MTEVTAPELARSVGADARTFREWLRDQWRAGHPLLAGHVLNARWLFSASDARQLAAEYRAQH